MTLTGGSISCSWRSRAIDPGCRYEGRVFTFISSTIEKYEMTRSQMPNGVRVPDREAVPDVVERAGSHKSCVPATSRSPPVVWRVFRPGFRVVPSKEPCARGRCSEPRRSGVFLPGRRPRAMSRFGRSARSPIRAPGQSPPPTSPRGWARDRGGAIRRRRVGEGPSRSDVDGRHRPRKLRAARWRRRPPPRPRPRRRGRTSRR